MEESFLPIPEAAETRLPPAGTLSGRATRFFLRRYPVWDVLDALSRKRVPVHRHSFWYMMGGIALFFFAVQVVTGVLLMVYYRPSQPWASVNRIVMEIPFGGLVRSVHHWAANLMIATLFVHLVSTLLMKAFRPPRELTWLTGVGLLGLSLVFGFSGYLLPWDELAFFATRVGIAEVEKVPLVGGVLGGLIRGGSDVSLDTIGRFFALHVVILPLALVGLIGAHLLFIQIQGVSEPDAFRARPLAERRYRPFFPDYVVNELPVWFFCLGLLLALAAALPRSVGLEADPSTPAPLGIKPDWYFLAPYQGLKLFPGSLELLGMALLGLAPLALLVLPFVDQAVPADRRGRLVTKAAVAGIVGAVALTLWGLWS